MHINSLLMDLNGLKTDQEIQSYIPTQLIKYYPDPSHLVYDYLVTGSGNNQKAMVTYGLKEIHNSDISHPHLLFKHLIKKDGNYYIFFDGYILEVCIKAKIFTNVNLTAYNYDIFNDLNKKSIVIADQNNFKLCTSNIKGKVLKLENLYSRCKKDMFVIKKKNIFSKVFIFIILTLCITFFIGKGLFLFNESKNKLKQLEEQYASLVISSNKSSEIETEYNELLNKLYILESQIPPSLYDVFYQLNYFGSDYIIKDFNYSNRYLTVNAISQNSIELIKSLNKSESFNFKQGSTVSVDNYEQVNFSGDIICP